MYLNKFMGVTPLAAGPQLLTSTGDIQYFPMPQRLKIQRIEALVSSAVVSSGPVSISVFARPTHGSTSGQVLLGVIIIPAGASVGQCYYKDLSDALVSVLSGQELVFNVSVAAAGGGAAGAVLPMFLADEDPEVPLNQPNLILSA
jgi:hypothetical protein